MILFFCNFWRRWCWFEKYLHQKERMLPNQLWYYFVLYSIFIRLDWVCLYSTIEVNLMFWGHGTAHGTLLTSTSMFSLHVKVWRAHTCTHRHPTCFVSWNHFFVPIDLSKYKWTENTHFVVEIICNTLGNELQSLSILFFADWIEMENRKRGHIWERYPLHILIFKISCTRINLKNVTECISVCIEY